jgi:N-acetylglucosaminyldiphosphoundecaprenol N-acetyl-beta-D-mannosaminyltransferase
VITANVDHLVILERDRAFRRAYEQADLVVPDGVPLLWAARLLGHRLPGRIAGSDLIFDLCALCGREGLGVYLLGGRPGVADAAARAITARYAGLRVVGTACPPFGFERRPAEVRRIVEAIRASGADLLLAGLGAPKQELFLAQHWDDLGVTVGLGVGIALEYLAGTMRRAPRWMQSSGLEWSWRLLSEPRRLWKRYLLRDPRFFWLLAKQRASAAWGRTDGAASA